MEALVTGRVLLDLYPEQPERRLEDVETFRQYPGGFATNVATGLARLGVGTAISSSVGDDGHGRHIRRFLSAEGVDCRWLAVDETLPTALAFCEIWPPDDFPITYHRTPTCPDWEVTLDTAGVDREVAASVPLMYASATALAGEASRHAMASLIKMRRAGLARRSSTLTGDRCCGRRSATTRGSRLLVDGASVILGTDGEWHAAGLDPAEWRDAIRVVKHGPRGRSVYYPGGTLVREPALPVTVTNGSAQAMRSRPRLATRCCAAWSGRRGWRMLPAHSWPRDIRARRRCRRWPSSRHSSRNTNPQKGRDDECSRLGGARRLSRRRVFRSSGGGGERSSSGCSTISTVPIPVSPMFFDIGGWWLTCDHMFRRFGTPFASDWIAKRINGYLYTAAVPADPRSGPRQRSTAAGTRRGCPWRTGTRSRSAHIWTGRCRTTRERSWRGGGSASCRRWTGTSLCWMRSITSTPRCSNSRSCSRTRLRSISATGRSTG